MSKTAVITGAGSGVGRAIALKLAQLDWRVAIAGRRADALRETIGLAGPQGSRITPHACTVGDLKAVTAMAKRVFAEFDEVDVLVNAAGTNTPRRSLEVLSLEDYHELIATNFHGAYYCVQAFLPRMRARKSGTII